MTATGVPPGPPRRDALGLLVKMQRDRIAVFGDAVRQYGDAVRVPLGPKTVYLFNSPETAKHILADNHANYHKGIGEVHAKRVMGEGLLTSEGDVWRKQRAAIQPVFQARRIAAQAGVVGEEAEKLAAQLRHHVGGEPVDVRAVMTDLTLGVLGRTLLDADLGTFSSLGHSFEAVQNQAIFEMMTLNAVPLWLPLPSQLRFHRARRDLRRVVGLLTADRVARGAAGDDVISRLLASTDGETDRRVAERRLFDELVTLLLAGHETTASTLSWTFHLLDQNPETWEAIRAEASEVLDGSPVTMDTLRRLEYTSMVVEEVMRLYPPVWLIPRRALGADVIGGFSVPRRADVVVSPYLLHRHPELWPDPHRFDPERFRPGTATGRNRYSYIPFGAGPRFCVGNNLGMMEATIVVATVARDLRLRGVPGRQVRHEPMLTLRVRGGLPMSVHHA